MKSILKVIIALFIVVSICFAATVFYFSLNEKKYNSIMMTHISSDLTKNTGDFEEKVTILRDFVRKNVHPVTDEYNRLDTVGIEKLSSGIGWCDQASRVFMQLARPRGIKTRLLFLLNEKGSSPHSIAEAWDGKRWILVDPSYAGPGVCQTHAYT